MFYVTLKPALSHFLGNSLKHIHILDISQSVKSPGCSKQEGLCKGVASYEYSGQVKEYKTHTHFICISPDCQVLYGDAGSTQTAMHTYVYLIVFLGVAVAQV